jgi:DnaD/phage-associated family protein
MNLQAISECISFLDKLPYEVINVALTKTSEKDGGWKYAKKILNSWVAKKIDTIEKIETEELNFKASKQINSEIKQESEEERILRKTKELEESLNGDTGVY